MELNHRSMYMHHLSGALGQQTMTQRLVQELGLGICVGRICNEGSYLFEKELCSKFGVSRIVVRESLKILQSKGLISTMQSRGSKVAPMSEWSLLDREVLAWSLQGEFSGKLLIEFSEARYPILCEAAYYSAIRFKDCDLSKAENALSELQAAKNGQRDHLACEIEFYNCLLGTSGNRLIEQLHWFIEASCIYQDIYAKTQNQPLPENLGNYKEVVKFISNGEALRAKGSMRKLLMTYATPIR